MGHILGIWSLRMLLYLWPVKKTRWCNGKIRGLFTEDCCNTVTTGSFGSMQIWWCFFNKRLDGNSCTHLQSGSRGWGGNKNLFSVFVCALPADESALMFGYLTERENVNIFSQTFWAGLHAARALQSTRLSKWVLIDRPLVSRESHVVWICATPANVILSDARVWTYFDVPEH